MSITSFGIFYIALLFYAFVRSYRALAFLYALAYLFQTSMLFAVGNIGVTPYIICPILLIIKGTNLPIETNTTIRNIQTMSIIFIVFVVVQGIVAKLLFEGSIQVFEGSAMETSIGQGKVPFQFSFKIVTQWIYLILNMSGLISLIKHRKYLNNKFATQLIRASVLIVTILGIWKYVATNFFGWFPSDFFFNNVAYKMSNIVQSLYGRYRLSSIFTEASVCGLFLAAWFWNVFFSRCKRKNILFALILICLLLSLASTGFFAFGFGLALYIMISRRSKTILFVSTIIAVFLLIAVFFNLDQPLLNMTINKMDSGSAEVRTTIMRSQLDLFFETFGWGIGLGGTCAAGLLTTLVGHIGVIGTLLFGVWIWTIFKYLKANGTAILFLPLLVVLFGMCSSVGHLSYPTLWLELIIITCMAKSEMKNIT